MKPYKELLSEVFRDVKVNVGLRQQGLIPTVERMLDESKSWKEIGQAIGWDGETAKDWYIAESRMELSKLRNPDIRKALERARTLMQLLTIRQVVNAGDEAIAAAGLNPWCINEGLATGDETISPSFIDYALRHLNNEEGE